MTTDKRLIVDVQLADGQTFEGLIITNPAMVEWDFTAPKMGWPSHKDAPMLYTTFLVWAQLVHNGVVEKTDPANPKRTSFERFRTVDCLHIADTDDVDLVEGDADRDPTESGPAVPGVSDLQSHSETSGG
jgi:hypothetical protein